MSNPAVETPARQAPTPGGMRSALTRKVGGLSLYIWLIMLGVAVLAFAAWRTRAVPDEVNEDLAELDEPEPDYGISGNDGGDFSDTGGFSANGTPLPVITTPSGNVTDSNGLWAQRAVDYVVSQSLATRARAYEVINRYIEGEQLSWDDGKLRDAAINSLGAPPEGVTSGGTALEPGKRQSQTLPTNHTVKNSNDDTYTELAGIYYGSKSAGNVDVLQAANKTIPGGPFSPGTVIHIPTLVAPKYVIAKSPGYDNAGEIASKNSMAVASLTILNPSLKFPVKSGTRVRVR